MRAAIEKGRAGATQTNAMARPLRLQGPTVLAVPFRQVPEGRSFSVLQAKFSIGRPNDAYEQQADRIADEVVRSPTASAPAAQLHAGGPLLQRCACGGACPACAKRKREEQDRSLQRMVTPARDTTATPATHAVDPVLSREGEPLGAGARTFMESRFGRDFSRVRVHTDATAAASAASIHARAYTVGHHIVFGPGEYRPGTQDGHKLLAHELTHVLQQRSDAGPVLRRQSTSTTTVHVPRNICSPAQTREIGPAVSTAQRWLHVADTRLTAFTGSADSRSVASQSTARSLLRHFAASDVDTARYVRNEVRRIADRLRTDPGAPSPLTVECHGASDTSCGSAAAYVSGTDLVFCPSFFGSEMGWRIMAMIHEIAHSLPHMSGAMHITDRAYRSDRLYGMLTPGEALTNAESYAMLIRELATGPIGGTAVRDTFEDCPTDWRRALFMATARAQRWNRVAQTMMADRRPGMLSQWAALATANIGGQSAAQLNAAQSVYDRAQARFAGRIDFECESGTGGRCASYQTYWYALGDFHVCPSWRTLPTEEDRAESLLSGLYGYFRIVDDSTRRWRLARLARSLHEQFWARPSAADVAAALAGERTPPHPAPARPPGPPPPR